MSQATVELQSGFADNLDLDPLPWSTAPCRPEPAHLGEKVSFSRHRVQCENRRHAVDVAEVAVLFDVSLQYVLGAFQIPMRPGPRSSHRGLRLTGTEVLIQLLHKELLRGAGLLPLLLLAGDTNAFTGLDAGYFSG